MKKSAVRICGVGSHKKDPTRTLNSAGLESKHPEPAEQPVQPHRRPRAVCHPSVRASSRNVGRVYGSWVDADLSHTDPHGSRETSLLRGLEAVLSWRDGSEGDTVHRDSLFYSQPSPYCVRRLWERSLNLCGGALALIACI